MEVFCTVFYEQSPRTCTCHSAGSARATHDGIMANWSSGEYLAAFRAGCGASSSVGMTDLGSLRKETRKNFAKNCQDVYTEGHWDSKRAVDTVVSDRTKSETRLWAVYNEVRCEITNNWNPMYMRLLPDKGKLPSGTQKQEFFENMKKRIYVMDTYKKLTTNAKKKAKKKGRSKVEDSDATTAPAAPAAPASAAATAAPAAPAASTGEEVAVDPLDGDNDDDDDDEEFEECLLPDVGEEDNAAFNAFVSTVKISAADLKLMGVRAFLPKGYTWEKDLTPPQDHVPLYWKVWELHGPFGDNNAALLLKSDGTGDGRQKNREANKLKRKAAKEEGKVAVGDGKVEPKAPQSTSKNGATSSVDLGQSIHRFAEAKDTQNLATLFSMAKEMDRKDIMERSMEMMATAVFGKFGGVPKTTRDETLKPQTYVEAQVAALDNFMFPDNVGAKTTGAGAEAVVEPAATSAEKENEEEGA